MATNHTRFGKGLLAIAKMAWAIEALATDSTKFESSDSSAPVYTFKLLRSDIQDEFDDSQYERDFAEEAATFCRDKYDTYDADVASVASMAESFISYAGVEYSDLGMEPGTDVADVLTEYVNQMLDDSKQVRKCTVTKTDPTADGDNNGDGTLYVNDQIIQGAELVSSELIQDETWDVICTSDGTAGQETFSVRGTITGDAGTITVIGDTDGTSQITAKNGNVISDSSFESWASGTTTLASGSGGWSATDPNMFTSNAGSGGAFDYSLMACEFPTGATPHIADVEVGQALDPLTQYCFEVRYNGNFTTGSIGIYMSGATMGNVPIATISAGAASWTRQSAYIATPKALDPDETRLYCSAVNLDVATQIDCLRMFKMEPFGGMAWGVTRGETDFKKGGVNTYDLTEADRFISGTTENDKAGKIQYALGVLLGYGIQLPSGATASTEYDEGDLVASSRVKIIYNPDKGDRLEEWHKLAVGDEPWVLWSARPGITFRDRFISSVPVVTMLLGIVTEQSWEFNGRKGGAVDPNTTNVDPLNAIGGGLKVIVPSAGSADDDYFAFHQDDNYPFAITESFQMFVQGALKQTSDVGFLGGLVGSTNKATSTNLFTLPDDFIGFRLDTDAVDGYGDSKMRVITRSGGVSTETDIGIPLTTTQSFMANVSEDGTEVKFYVAGVLVATHTTNIPTAQLQFYTGLINRAGGAAASDLEVEICQLHLVQDDGTDFGQ